MEKFKIVVVEDEFVIAEDIRKQLIAAGYDVAGMFDSGEKAKAEVATLEPDVLLVDIRLNGEMDGIQLVQQLSTEMALPVVFITANSDAATYDRARKTNPHAFLVKPFTNANLLAAIDLALYHFANQSFPTRIDRVPGVPTPSPEDESLTVRNSLFIRTNGRYKKVDAHDILFAEAAGSYVYLQTSSERFTLAQNLSSFQKKTNLPNLLRIHRSFLVNINKVDSFQESWVFVGNHQLPLSDNCKAEFLAHVRTL